VVVASHPAVTRAAFQHGEDGSLFLPPQDRLTNVPEELAPRGFHHVEVARVVDMISQGAVRVRDTNRVLENWNRHAAKLIPRPETEPAFRTHLFIGHRKWRLRSGRRVTPRVTPRPRPNSLSRRQSYY